MTRVPHWSERRPPQRGRLRRLRPPANTHHSALAPLAQTHRRLCALACLVRGGDGERVVADLRCDRARRRRARRRRRPRPTCTTCPTGPSFDFFFRAPAASRPRRRRRGGPACSFGAAYIASRSIAAPPPASTRTDSGAHAALSTSSQRPSSFLGPSGKSTSTRLAPTRRPTAATSFGFGVGRLRRGWRRRARRADLPSRARPCTRLAGAQLAVRAPIAVRLDVDDVDRRIAAGIVCGAAPSSRRSR